ncbi:MAG: hypothetical protein QOJ41_1856 [Acidobacteriaceae bacterium]|nr:hypothetical protein [Acidobacteriaceae bacterium]
MKLPALAIVTAFALGIACGLIPAVAHRGSSHAVVAFLLCNAATSLLIGIVFAFSLASCCRGTSVFIVLGNARRGCGFHSGKTEACVDAGKINLKSPLRYFGRLADEPEKLPWGAGYDIELSCVDYKGLFVPASGGLHLGYVAQADQPGPLALHVRDFIAVLTRAKLPQLFRDEGASDRRACLSQQGVDVVGALRAPELLELVKPAGPRIFS